MRIIPERGPARRIIGGASLWTVQVLVLTQRWGMGGIRKSCMPFVELFDLGWLRGFPRETDMEPTYCGA